MGLESIFILKLTYDSTFKKSFVLGPKRVLITVSI
jgi:hypothetical protein